MRASGWSLSSGQKGAPTLARRRRDPSIPSPYVDALAQLVSAVGAHLLAAVALAGGEHEDFLNGEAKTLRDVGEDQVHRDAGPSVADVVVDHEEQAAGFQHPC